MMASGQFGDFIKFSNISRWIYEWTQSLQSNNMVEDLGKDLLVLLKVLKTYWATNGKVRRWKFYGVGAGGINPGLVKLRLVWPVKL